LLHKWSIIDLTHAKKSSQGSEPIGWFQKSTSLVFSGRRDSKTAYGGPAVASRLPPQMQQGLDITPPLQSVPNPSVPGPSSTPFAAEPHRNSMSMRRTSSFLFWAHSFTSNTSEPDDIPIRLSPVPPPTLFAKIFNFATIAIPLHQQNNYAKWRFMNPGGDIFHHTSNAELFSLCMLALLIYTFLKRLGSARFFALSTAFIGVSQFVVWSSEVKNLVLILLGFTYRGEWRFVSGRKLLYDCADDTV
jgi:hypothetical protein